MDTPMTRTTQYLAAHERLHDVILRARQAFDAAVKASGGTSMYRLRPERAIEAIGHARVASALADMLAILEPADAVVWQSRAAEYRHVADARGRTLLSDFNGLERDSQRWNRARRGMPY
jgi:hypothetical protein